MALAILMDANAFNNSAVERERYNQADVTSTLGELLRVQKVQTKNGECENA